MDDSCMSTNSNFIFAKPCYTFTYIFNIFTSNGHDDITMLGFLLIFRFFIVNIRQRSIHKQSQFRINLSIMDTRKSFLPKILFLKIPAS